jgi:hypothetical protein
MRINRSEGSSGIALRLGRRPLGKPQLEGITHCQRGAPGTLRNLRIFFNPATKLGAELPDKGRVVVPRDRKAIDPSLALNPGLLLFHLICSLRAARSGRRFIVGRKPRQPSKIHY